MDVFGTNAAPEDPIEAKITIAGLQNPYSSKPAGSLIIRSYSDEGYLIDEGTSDPNLVIPESGDIAGNTIVVTNDVTSSTTSSFTFVFQQESQIPKDGFIYITVPEELVLRDSEVQSGGSCTNNPKFICTDVKNNVIIIKVQELIPANQPVTIVLEGITSPRSDTSTSTFIFTTFDSDGKSEIATGYDKVVVMT